MATLTSDLAASNSGFTGPGGGVVYVRECVYSALSTLALNDVIQMIPVAAGERVVDLQLIVEDIDSATTLVLDVGDGDDTDRYIDGATIGQAGGFARLGAGVDTDAEKLKRHGSGLQGRAGRRQRGDDLGSCRHGRELAGQIGK